MSPLAGDAPQVPTSPRGAATPSPVRPAQHRFRMPQTFRGELTDLLQVIQGNVDLLDDLRESDPEVRRCLRGITLAVERSALIIGYLGRSDGVR